MLYNSNSQGKENWRDNVFKNISTGKNEQIYIRQLLDIHDISLCSHQCERHLENSITLFYKILEKISPFLGN